MGRPSKIHLTVSARDPRTDELRELAITDAICEQVAYGVWPGNAAQMYGIRRSTLHNWRVRGADALAAAAEHAEDPDTEEVDYEAVPEVERPFAIFLDALARAEAEGLGWHEQNVRRAAETGKEQGGRLSLEFLSRRLRAQYSREVKVEHGGKVDLEIEKGTDERIDELMAKLEPAGETSPAR